MTVLQMQCFLEAAELGSFAVASEKLYISQPTMSRQIRTLEEELQVALFVRDHNAVKLTDIGRELLPMIQSLYKGYMGASKEIQETVNRRLDRLRIGILDSLNFVDPMRDAVLMVKRAYPNANIQICHLPLRQSGSALRRRQPGRAVYAQYLYGQLGSGAIHGAVPGQNVSGCAL